MDNKKEYEAMKSFLIEKGYICNLCENASLETKRCYVGGWDKCKGKKYKFKDEQTNR